MVVTQRFVLDEIVDPYGARVEVTRAADGSVSDARFDLTGLPRVEPLLVGRPVAEVPRLVERLCGVCPAAHHLAGVRALESLAGTPDLTPPARAARRLLHHASAVATHAVRAVTTDRDDALELRRFAKAVTTAVGSPGHFPVTAVPGGIAAPVPAGARDACRELVASALAAALRIADRASEGMAQRAGEGVPTRPFPGADVALVDERGRPDLLGTRLRAVAADGTVLLPGSPASSWDDLIAESFPGTSSPRPYLVALGPERGAYRVGPVAQLRIGELGTPRAADLQDLWRRSGGGAGAARTVMTVYAVEVIGDLLDDPDLTSPAIRVDAGGEAGPADGVGVGWVDGPRGLLVHRYRVGEDRIVRDATILTPTAQNEPWLAWLLRGAVAEPGDGFVPREPRVENAIREADPCLPVSSAPAGAMGVVVEERPTSSGGR